MFFINETTHLYVHCRSLLRFVIAGCIPGFQRTITKPCVLLQEFRGYIRTGDASLGGEHCTLMSPTPLHPSDTAYCLVYPFPGKNGGCSLPPYYTYGMLLTAWYFLWKYMCKMCVFVNTCIKYAWMYVSGGVGWCLFALCLWYIDWHMCMCLHVICYAKFYKM